METAETLQIKADLLKQEILKIEHRVEEVEDVGLSIEDSEMEQDLRRICREIRSSLDVMESELEPDEPWLVG